ncbi:MAG: efflux RND transporter periplasmic adaptor subunit [Proteobacteria bacterium]|nr:efflux RND transporter periplasmic adaptor subunit [Pseudomonadota bacterium]
MIRESDDSMTETDQPGNVHTSSLREVIERHENLRKAYLEIEHECNNIRDDLKKAHKIRLFVTFFIILVFVAAGLYEWKRIHHAGSHANKSAVGRKKGSSVTTHAVKSGPISESIALEGTLKPGEAVNIVCPFDGIVKGKHFQYGEYVKRGQPLLELDISDIEVKYDGAKTDYIKAADKVKNMRDWENSDDVMKAKRSLSRSNMILEAQKKTFQATEGLFKEGIVSETEYENARQQYSSSKLDYDNAVDELKNARTKGTGNYLEVAALDMKSAKIKFDELKKQLDRANVTAPLDGVVVLPSSGDKDKKDKRIDKGVSFTRGETLVTIGNIENLSVHVDVDEMEVLKVKNGQDVTVTGNAFPGIMLKGKVSGISSQATQDEAQKGPPSFRVVVVLDGLPQSVTEKIRLKGMSQSVNEKIRLGMSADVKILTYSKTDALAVPVKAVAEEGGNYFLTVKDKGTGQTKKVKVETGITTPDLVEIINGIKEGDEVLIEE